MDFKVSQTYGNDYAAAILPQPNPAISFIATQVHHLPYNMAKAQDFVRSIEQGGRLMCAQAGQALN